MIAAGVFAATRSIALAMTFFGLPVALTVAAIVIFVRVRRAEERARMTDIRYRLEKSMRRRKPK